MLRPDFDRIFIDFFPKNAWDQFLNVGIDAATASEVVCGHADDLVRNHAHFLKRERLNFCPREAANNPALLDFLHVIDLLFYDLDDRIVVHYNLNKALLKNKCLPNRSSLKAC